MKKWWPLFIALCAFTACIIVGSFYDWGISKAIFSDRNGFGIFMTAFGLIPGYAIIAFIGGVLLRVFFKYKYPVWFKIILIGLALFGLGSATYFSANEFFSVNGFNIPSLHKSIWAELIALAIQTGPFLLGFFLSKNLNNKNSWIGVLIVAAAVIISLVPVVNGLKAIMHRPRFRTVIQNIEGLSFHQWWEPCSNYKEIMANSGIIKEEFKSFPSGHAGASMLFPFLLYLITYFVPKLRKYKDYLFIGGTVYSLVICFARVLVGAHYLSDVGFGGLTALACMWIAIWIVEKFKFFEDKNEQEKTARE